jgi:vitamin B12 transporter
MKGLKMKLLISGLVISLMVMLPASTLGEETDEEVKKKEEVVLEEVVVTATRIPTPIEEVGRSITVITSEEIEAKDQPLVSEVLKGIPGIDVWTLGSPGSRSSVSLRGTEPSHTLVLIDGLEMNDPSRANRLFDFGNLTTDNIDQIEILRGPQSILYGADAIGGVINKHG